MSESDRSPRHSGIFRKPPTALVIEPDEALRRMVRWSLERWAGFTVLDAGCPHEGIALARTFRASAVVLEQRLPRLTTQAAMRCLRAANGTKDSLVVVLSDGQFALPSTESLAVVQKPFSPLQLARRIGVLTAVYAA